MGMDACLVAVGKFNKNVIDYLDYTYRDYENVKEGTQVITDLFHCVTSETSIELAECFGIDPWNFNTHFMSNNYLKSHIEKANFDDIGFLLDKFNDYDKFQALVENRFDFYYRPNG